MNKTNTQIYIIMILLFILTVIVVGGGVYFWQEQKIDQMGQEEKNNTLTTVPTQIINVTKPQETAVPTITLKTSPGSSASDKDLITAQFGIKYNKQAGDVTVTVAKNNGTHAAGGVSFAGEMGGGMWFAYKSADKWTIVSDGNGTPLCSNIQPYNFPKDMIGECWDETTNKLIQL